MSTGRPHLPYKTSWGEYIAGLAHGKDGRWRIVATGERFREDDEDAAIDRFRQWQQKNAPHAPIFLPIRRSADLAEVAEAGDRLTTDTELHKIEHHDGSTEIGYYLDSDVVWSFLRQQLRDNALYVAQRTGIPQLANYHQLSFPMPPIPLADLERLYLDKGDATDKSKREAVAPFKRLIEFTGARTLDGLTTESLSAFRDHIVSASGLHSSATIGAYFCRIRFIVKFALKHGSDEQQIGSALNRMKVLYPPPNHTRPNPQPISRADFQKLLDAANGPWRAMLLVALNCCLYMEEVCRLEWSDFDFGEKVFVSHRKKRGQVIRVATLWEETVSALEAIPRRGASPYVFVSPRGTRYNKNTKINDFKDFRERAGVPDVTFSHIRDGAYTAACQLSEEKYSRLIAGHKLAGLTDNYVKRNPSFVKPACEAVYRFYFGKSE